MAGARFGVDRPQFTSSFCHRGEHLWESYSSHLLLGSSHLLGGDVPANFIRLLWRSHMQLLEVLKMSFFLFSGRCQWKKIPRGPRRMLQLGENLLPMYAVYYKHRSHSHEGKKNFESGFVWKPFNHRITSCLFSYTITLRWLYSFTRCLALVSIHGGQSLLVIIKTYMDMCLATLAGIEEGYSFCNPWMKWYLLTTFSSWSPRIAPGYTEEGKPVFFLFLV